MEMNDSREMKKHSVPVLLRSAVFVFCIGITLLFLVVIMGGTGRPAAQASAGGRKLEIMDKFELTVSNAVSEAMGGVLKLQKSYWLPDDTQAAPRPNPECFGHVEDPKDMEKVLQKAQEKFHMENMVFTTETPILEGSQVHYYLDDTIFSVTWKQAVDRGVYTMSEVKIAHPSQFRRFLSGGSYGSGVLYTTSDMAGSVNAVTASSGDYYSYRPGGITVYDGEVRRVNAFNFDTCFVNRQGDLLFTRAGQFSGEPEVRAFVEANNVNFSLCFGPILVENGEVSVPYQYPVGEISQHYSRAAIGQQEKLHYVIAMANQEHDYPQFPTIEQFARRLCEMGVVNAYALDGGQTATLCLEDQVINQVSYGNERLISDIVYFATAIPEQQGREDAA